MQFSVFAPPNVAGDMQLLNVTSAKSSDICTLFQMATTGAPFITEMGVGMDISFFLGGILDKWVWPLKVWDMRANVGPTILEACRMPGLPVSWLFVHRSNMSYTCHSEVSLMSYNRNPASKLFVFQYLSFSKESSNRTSFWSIFFERHPARDSS